MAERTGESERNGRKTWVYDNGLQLYQDTGSIAKPADGTVITPERSTLLHRRRQEKQARLLRERIIATHNGSMPSQVTTSAEAFAEAGAMLHEQIVLNSEAYPRDRMEAWEKLGKYAQVLPADVRAQPADPTGPAIAAGVAAGVASVLERVMRDVLAQQTAGADVIEGKVSDGQLED